MAGLLVRIGRGIRGAGKALTRGATGEEQCAAGHMLVEGVGEVCIDEMSLDLDTGELVYENATDENLIWDGYASEWVTLEEYNLRSAQRAERQEQLERSAETARGAEGIQRERQVYDSLADEWVTASEFARRTGQRSALGAFLARTRPQTVLPNLSLLSGLRVALDARGAATLDGKPALDVLADPGQDLIGKLRDQLAPRTSGPKDRERTASTRRRLMWVAMLVALVVLLLVRRRAAK